MKRFYVRKPESQLLHLLPSLLIILALVLFFYGSANLSDSGSEQE